MGGMDRLFLFSIIFLGMLPTSILISQGYSYASPEIYDDISSPIYKLNITLLQWNGSGYLPVTAPGEGKIIMTTVGYDAIVTNVSVVNRTSEECTVKIEYVITRAYGINVTVNETFSKLFVVDTRTNSFILNDTLVFFPFYICNDSVKYTYHFGERVSVNKKADLSRWDDVAYGGKIVNMTVGPLYSVVGEDIMGYLCSKVDLQELKCAEFEPYATPSIDVDLSNHYSLSIYGTYPGDPLGILNGSVEVLGGIVKSEKTAKLLGARVEGRFDDEDPAKYLAGVVILVIAGIILWRVRR